MNLCSCFPALIFFFSDGQSGFSAKSVFPQPGKRKGRVESPEDAYVNSSLLSASLAVKLLYGNAEPARKIAAQRTGLLSIPEYVKTIDRINRTLTSENL